MQAAQLGKSIQHHVLGEHYFHTAVNEAEAALEEAKRNGTEEEIEAKRLEWKPAIMTCHFIRSLLDMIKTSWYQVITYFIKKINLHNKLYNV